MGLFGRGSGTEPVSRQEKLELKRIRQEKIWKERARLTAEMEEQFPGYMEENEKLRILVKTMTGVRILFSFFYVGMCFLYGLDVTQAAFLLIGPLFFYAWYSYMLQSSRLPAVLMMACRGLSIAMSGASILEMSWWAPYPILFMLVFAAAMEFIEAVFCIYVLFNRNAAQTVRMNREFVRRIRAGV